MGSTFTRQETCAKKTVWGYANTMIKGTIGTGQARPLAENDIQATSEISDRGEPSRPKRSTVFPMYRSVISGAVRSLFMRERMISDSAPTRIAIPQDTVGHGSDVLFLVEHYREP
jgi:hypothetical protein